MLRELTFAAALAALAAAGLSAPARAQAAPPAGALSPFATASEQEAAMAAGTLTSEDLVKSYLARIAELDKAGPRLNAVIALNPHALADARRLDAERKAGRVRGPLHGVPVLLKDNIESADGTATTAGSLALKDNVTNRDAPLVKRLTDAGAVILGKANLSEWANFRSTHSISGWTGIGGLVRNPYSLDRTACGSSAGSGAAVAAGLVTLAVGTETDGSVTCPAAANGVVGLKPTVGLVSRTHVVPISAEQDTPGPMTRSVHDAAAMLAAMAGSDAADAGTKDADAHKADYLAGLKPDALQGARIGVLRMTVGRSPQTDAIYEDALAALRKAGAVLVEVKGPDDAALGAVSANESEALRVEFKAALNAYLAGLPPKVTARSLDALIAFNNREPRETPLFAQEIFEAAARAPAITDPGYLAQRANAGKLARAALDKMLQDANVEILVGPSTGPATIVDPINGSRSLGSYSTLPAVSGYPHLTVPMGNVSGLPVNLSLIGPAWSEARLLALGYAFEQATHARINPQFLPNVGARPEFARAYDPR
ncbi:MAG TPA: amidase [Phenylobacterium sp.]|uniref:amidase n=1 Tax=Phenylobacterium sp. TaxID=1871053 RepID=UPI002BD7AF5C|nr:amidase [Phenylobacterium sp.]HXA39247.1 amidase [Phenylobacterium sp.]